MRAIIRCHCTAGHVTFPTTSLLLLLLSLSLSLMIFSLMFRRCRHAYAADGYVDTRYAIAAGRYAVFIFAAAADFRHYFRHCHIIRHFSPPRCCHTLFLRQISIFAADADASLRYAAFAVTLPATPLSPLMPMPPLPPSFDAGCSSRYQVPVAGRCRHAIDA